MRIYVEKYNIEARFLLPGSRGLHQVRVFVALVVVFLHVSGGRCPCTELE